MLDRHIDAISASQIKALVEQNVSESKRLEFKQQLPSRDLAGKKEFLADVSSFANASGGDIIFGISEQDADGQDIGGAASIAPIPADQIDQSKLWIEEVVRTGISPRMQIQVHEVSGFGSSGQDCVIVLQIPQSFSAPHVVTLKGGFRFYSRSSAGKYQLDVEELRTKFLATESQAERVREFRQERLGRILAGGVPTQLSSSMLAVLHVIPLSTFLNDTKHSLTSLQHSLEFGPFGQSGTTRFNLDGRLTCCSSDPKGERSERYCQLFFNGVAEAVAADLVHGRTESDSPEFVGHLNSAMAES